jgi:hypothetical protein
VLQSPGPGGYTCALLHVAMYRMRILPPPLSVTLLPPSMTSFVPLSLNTLAVDVRTIFSGSGPQLNVMIPPFATALTNAAPVQLAAVPVPTTVVGEDTSSAWPSAGIAAWPSGYPAGGASCGFVPVPPVPAAEVPALPPDEVPPDELPPDDVPPDEVPALPPDEVPPDELPPDDGAPALPLAPDGLPLSSSELQPATLASDTSAAARAPRRFVAIHSTYRGPLPLTPASFITPHPTLEGRPSTPQKPSEMAAVLSHWPKLSATRNARRIPSRLVPEHELAGSAVGELAVETRAQPSGFLADGQPGFVFADGAFFDRGADRGADGGADLGGEAIGVDDGEVDGVVFGLTDSIVPGK